MNKIHDEVACFIQRALQNNFDYPVKADQWSSTKEGRTVFTYHFEWNGHHRHSDYCIELTTRALIMHTLTLTCNGVVIDTFDLPPGAVYHLEADILLWLCCTVAHIRNPLG